MADPLPLNERDGWVATAVAFGALAGTQPVDENPVTDVGHGGFSAGFGGIFYNRIQIEPAIIDLGNLITDKATPVYLWNGFLEPKLLQAINATDNEGVSIDTPIAIPSNIGALQEVTYTVTAITDGPSTIDASFQWVIDDVAYSIGVVGTRVVVFPFAPNWGEPVRENLEWLTIVERAYSGDEQRARWRDAARKDMEFSVALTNRRASAKLENIMFGWQSRSFAVPIVSERAPLLAAAAVNTSALSVNTTNLGFYAGQPILISTDENTYEAAEIDTLTSTQINLRRPLTTSWDVGTSVYPAGVGQMSANQPILRETDHHVTASFQWRFAAGDAMANTPVAAAATTYRTYEVYLRRANWATRPTFTYSDAYETFGNGTSGLLEFDQTSDWPTIIRQMRIDLRNRAEIADFRKFIGRRAGRLSPCWIPSWNDDFILTQNVDATASVITVEDNGYRAFVEAHDARRDIAIFFKGSDAPLLARINSTVDNLDGTVNLVLSAAIGQTFTVAQVKRICHMNLFCLASDVVTIDWETTTVATSTLNWQLVKE